MKFLFIVQGEGRGHLTQAIALAEMIKTWGHEVTGALVGSDSGCRVQGFFRDLFPAEIIPFSSPALVYSRKTRALSLTKTLYAAGRNFHKYTASLWKIRRVILQKEPDVIINFYDSLAGIHQFLFPEKCPMICVAHQYLMLHRGFEHPPGNRLNRLLVNLNSRITALASERKLALSFYAGEPDRQRRIFLVPPLLRQGLMKMETSTGDYFLAYVTQESMAEEIVAWQKKNPGIKIHCFSDRPITGEVAENLYFHQIDPEKFLAMMSACRGLISTAGFESVGEAMLLGKPVLMVPLRRHYEQTCNAVDAERAGAGIYRTSFDADPFLEFLPQYRDCRHEFRAWVEKAPSLFFRELACISQDAREARTNRVSIPATIMDTPPIMRA